MNYPLRELHTLPELEAAQQLLTEIWGGTPGGIDTALLKAFTHTGNYVAGAFDGERLIAAGVGFLAGPGATSLHSHIAGVRKKYSGQGLGYALKMHQQQWCQERDIATITWTFDPLVARNAYFNLHKLGATPVAYFADFYGEMTDALNVGQATDRMLVQWPTNPAAAVPRQNLHTTHTRVSIPADIESVRAEQPRIAHEARLKLRHELGERMHAGWRVLDFDATHTYTLEAPNS